MLAWRSNPAVYEGFYQQTKPLKWEEHIKWLASRNQDWRTFIIETDHKIGVVTIGQLDHWCPEIGYYIGEVSAWRNGYGSQAVSLALQWLRDNGYEYCHTTVLNKNRGSLRLLQNMGFTILGNAREREVWLQKKL